LCGNNKYAIYFEQFRAAARDGVIEAGMEPVMAEDSERFPAQSLSLQKACFEGIDESDIFVLILGQRYGDPTEIDLSAVEEKYWHARLSGPELKVFVHDVDREPQQNVFLARIGKRESWSSMTGTSIPWGNFLTSRSWPWAIGSSASRLG